MKQPNITNKQQEIIRLLYTHRYLDRTHIQALLNHKDKRRIISWLKDLRDKHYINWIYDGNDFANKTKPAIYYIGINGIRLLRQSGGYPADDLRKRYKDNSRSQSYIERCLLIAECCVTINGNDKYAYVTEPDYSRSQNLLSDLIDLKPHLVINKQDIKVSTQYMLEVFNTTLPRYQIRNRIKKYVDYLMTSDSKPIVLIVCPTKAELIYAKRRTKMLIEDLGAEDLHIRYTTVDMLKAQDVISPIWEEA